MHKRSIISILIILPLLAMACALVPAVTINTTRGSGHVVSENRDVKNFQSVSLSGSGQLIITQGDTEALRIEAEDNILPLIESDVRAGTLYLGFKPNVGNIITNVPVKYYLNAKLLNAIVLAGSGSIQSDNLKANNLAITTSGSGSIDIKVLTADTLKLTMSGSGSSSLAGMVGQQTAELTGSGSYDGGNLDTQQTTLILTGSGSMTVWARDSLNITVSGSGSVDYYGKPVINQVITGSGKINSLGDK